MRDVGNIICSFFYKLGLSVDDRGTKLLFDCSKETYSTIIADTTVKREAICCNFKYFVSLPFSSARRKFSNVV